MCVQHSHVRKAFTFCLLCGRDLARYARASKNTAQTHTITNVIRIPESRATGLVMCILCICVCRCSVYPHIHILIHDSACTPQLYTSKMRNNNMCVYALWRCVVVVAVCVTEFLWGNSITSVQYQIYIGLDAGSSYHHSNHKTVKAQKNNAKNIADRADVKFFAHDIIASTPPHMN